MQSLRSLLVLARSTTAAPSTSALLQRSAPRVSSPQTVTSIRALSLLSLRRPQFHPTPMSFSPSASPLTPSTALAVPTSSDGTLLDLVPKISSHPAVLGMQVRNGPRATYDPSHRVRKRRHGFLARLRSRTGRKVLKRRTLKGRWSLTH